MDPEVNSTVCVDREIWGRFMASHSRPSEKTQGNTRVNTGIGICNKGFMYISKKWRDRKTATLRRNHRDSKKEQKEGRKEMSSGARASQ